MSLFANAAHNSQVTFTFYAKGSQQAKVTIRVGCHYDPPHIVAPLSRVGREGPTEVAGLRHFMLH